MGGLFWVSVDIGYHSNCCGPAKNAMKLANVEKPCAVKGEGGDLKGVSPARGSACFTAFLSSPGIVPAGGVSERTHNGFIFLS